MVRDAFGLRRLLRMSLTKAPFDDVELGERYHRKLLDLARLRRRSPRAQTLYLVLWALERACSGEDVELSQERLEKLRAEIPQVA